MSPCYDWVLIKGDLNIDTPTASGDVNTQGERLAGKGSGLGGSVPGEAMRAQDETAGGQGWGVQN